MEGFLHYRFGGLIFGGAYFRNFTVIFNNHVLNEANYDVKNYGDQGECYPLKLISLVNWPGRITPHPKGFLVAIHFSGINAVLLTSFSTIITTFFQI